MREDDLPQKYSSRARFTSDRTEWLADFIRTNKLTILLYLYLILFAGCFFSVRWANKSRSKVSSYEEVISELSSTTNYVAESTTNRTEFPLLCSSSNSTAQTITCPSDHYPTTFEPAASSENLTCPEYFKWIQEDLKPWKSKGISRDMVEAGKRVAYFRLVIVNGRVYVEKYKNAFQTRDVFTIWGILQLLRLYPGKIPDLDLMFECDDRPVIQKADYNISNLSTVPPVFHYCGDDSSFDIVFPDWSFWGWPEINIKPWVTLLEELEEGNKRVKWIDREPYAYWKGNLHMGQRNYLLKCNSTEEWKTLIYYQRWSLETKHGFRTSNLADQCTHRYKIYMEGKAWSVSQKYIQGCDSMFLFVKSRYYEFFTRSLEPMKHYWPIGSIRKLCISIKQAVEWGNRNPYEAQEIGKAGNRFIMEDLKMKNVYDYMFHLLSEYAKLLRYKPTIPDGAVEVCSETMACSARGLEQKWKIESMVRAPSTTTPCTMHF